MKGIIMVKVEKKLRNCCICGEKTGNLFNIKFKKKPICESCANAITKQQLDFLIGGK